MSTFQPIDLLQKMKQLIAFSNMTNQEAEILVKIIEHRLLSKEKQAYLLDKWRKLL